MKASINLSSNAMKKSSLGLSLLNGIMPKGINFDGEPHRLTVRRNGPPTDDKYFYWVSEDEPFSEHVDIDGQNFALVYDLKKHQTVDYVYIASFFSSGRDYTVGKFAVYLSDSEQDFFSPENCVLEHNNEHAMVFGEDRNHADFRFDLQDAAGRYLALRVYSCNSTDGVTRLRNFTAYSKQYNYERLYLNEHCKGSLLCDVVPTVSGQISGEASFLTDGIVMDDDRVVTLQNATVQFSFEKAQHIDHITLFGRNIEQIFINGEQGSLSKIAVENGRCRYDIALENGLDTTELSLTVAGDPAVIDQICAISVLREIHTDENKVITEDYLGLGANVLPMHLFESSRLLGFTEAYMELEKRRVIASGIHTARVWFQIDWFVMDEDGYKNRRYVFNSPKMMAFYKYLDALKAADCDVELNFGWKVGYTAQSWFSFPNVFNRKNSAPRDLDHFATSCSDCLKELFRRGYSNIKYLTFYNESNGGGTDSGWDFLVPSGMDVEEYWIKMLKTCDAQLRADGLRDKVEIWAAEIAGGGLFRNYTAMEGWAERFEKEVPKLYDRYSFHLYMTTYELAKTRAERMRQLSSHPICVTEFGNGNYGTVDGLDFDFEFSDVSTVLGYMNGGASTMLYWVLSAVYIDEHFFLNNPDTTLWRFPTEKASGVDAVTGHFYAFSLLTHYFPKHSKIIEASASQSGVHTAACVTKDGDFTVAVELRNDNHIGKELRVKLPFKTDKKLYRHVYRLDTPQDGNMLIPPAEEVEFCGDTLCEKRTEEYQLIVYTTLKPVEQVVTDQILVRLKAGESVQLSAKVIDGDGPITWSMCDCHYNFGYPGSITKDGVYTADKRLPSDSVEGNINAVFAAKAEAPSGAYTIVLLKVEK